jgi:hypothetical protein
VPLARHQHTEVALDGTKHMHGTPATETEDLNRLGSAIVTKQVSTISRSSSTSLSRHACNQATDCSTPPPPPLRQDTIDKILTRFGAKEGNGSKR